VAHDTRLLVLQASDKDRVATKSDYREMFLYLTRLDLSLPETEGLALSAFSTAIDTFDEMDPRWSYRASLALAECLAVFMSSDPSYHRIAQSYLKHHGQTLVGPMIATRAYSKLAEIDPALVNVSPD
jgi:hypothetical protein